MASTPGGQWRRERGLHQRSNPVSRRRARLRKRGLPCRRRPRCRREPPTRCFPNGRSGRGNAHRVKTLMRLWRAVRSHSSIGDTNKGSGPWARSPEGGCRPKSGRHRPPRAPELEFGRNWCNRKYVTPRSKIVVLYQTVPGANLSKSEPCEPRSGRSFGDAPVGPRAQFGPTPVVDPQSWPKRAQLEQSHVLAESHARKRNCCLVRPPR